MRSTLARLAAATWAAGCLGGVGAHAADWEPIPAEVLKATKPTVAADADCEALLWDVAVEDRAQGDEPVLILRHRLRLKLFDERAVESQKQIDIAFGARTSISEIRARTVKPDGTVLELRDQDVFERTLAKGAGLETRVKSFALPGLEPGVVVEYRWVERRAKALAHHIDLDLQRDIPVQLLRYHIKPLPGAGEAGYAMQAKFFGVEPVAFEPEGNGFNAISYRNVPAFVEEPMMGAERSRRRWMLVYYTDEPNQTPAAFWRAFGRGLDDAARDARKSSGALVRVAREAVGDAATPAEKALRLARLCQSRVHRLDDDASELTQERRRRARQDRRPEEVLRSGQGNGGDVLRLFLALAAGAGLDARLVALPDGSLHGFDGALTSDYLMVSRSIAVRDAERWFFLDPAAMYLPAGMLRWQEEGQQGIVSDPQEPLLVTVPASPPDKSIARREARLRLSADGTVEGEVREEMSGHLAAWLKEQSDEKSAEERQQQLEESLRGRLSGAELSQISIENVKQAELPLVRRYHVKVPGFAQRTGRRLFVQPSFFERGAKAPFTSSAREHPIRFPYAWAEEDLVRIELPPGFTLEVPSLPGALDAAPVAAHQVSAKMVEGNVLEYRRSFRFGSEGHLAFPAASYEPLKTFFDRVTQADDHALTLTAATPAASQP